MIGICAGGDICSAENNNHVCVGVDVYVYDG